MLIKAAINEARTRAEHPAIPLTPAEQAAEARGAVLAGAGAIHVRALLNANLDAIEAALGHAGRHVSCTESMPARGRW